MVAAVGAYIYMMQYIDFPAELHMFTFPDTTNMEAMILQREQDFLGIN